MRHRLVCVILLLSLGLQTTSAARRRGAKFYPSKETGANMSRMNRVFIGWMDLREDDWAVHGYSSKTEWAGIVNYLNGKLLGFCQTRLPGKTVVGAKQKGDENVIGYDLYIKLGDVLIDYTKYHLHVSLHFIDPTTNAEIGLIPARAYFGNDWGFSNYLSAAIDEVSQKIGIEVNGGKNGKRSNPRP